MAIATLDAYKAAITQQKEIISINIISSAAVVGRTYDLWTASAPAGVAPGAAAVPTNATVGSPGQTNPASGQYSIIGARFSALNPGTYLICDRLSHISGLSGTTTGNQACATAALTRFTSGVGVMMGITIYSQLGTTATTVTAAYKNTAAADKTTPAVVIGGTGFREANRLILLPLAAGDTGVISVATVALVATTGTAGNFGVTLFKPLYMIAVDEVSGVVSAAGFITGKTSGGIPAIPDNACLFPVSIMQGTNSMGCGALLLEEN